MTDAQLAYREFLKTPFWKELSARKRAKVKKCQRCRSKIMLQSHHTVYRENWFDTKLKDLEVLCRTCHRKEHGLSVPEEDATDRRVFFWVCAQFIENIHKRSCGNDIPEEDDIDIEEVREFALELEPEPAVDFHLGQCVKWHWWLQSPESTAEMQKFQRGLNLDSAAA